MNGIRNIEVFKQRPKWSAVHQESSSRGDLLTCRLTPFEIQKLRIENL